VADWHDPARNGITNMVECRGTGLPKLGRDEKGVEEKGKGKWGGREGKDDENGPVASTTAVTWTFP